MIINLLIYQIGVPVHLNLMVYRRNSLILSPSYICNLQDFPSTKT